MADYPARTAVLARILAEHLHDGQVRKDGSPYFAHCDRVAFAVREHGNRARIAAWLHDVLEDTPLSYDVLAKIFGDEIALDVAAVSRIREEDYARFVERVCRESDVAVLVKLADVRDNLGGVVPGDLLGRYRAAELKLLTEVADRGLAVPRGRTPTASAR